MSKTTVIVHGWSDSKKSFRDLAAFVGSLPGRTVETLHLADWISMDDDVTYADLVEAMNRAWHRMMLPTSPRSVDVIVHSTGSLVVRDWMTTHYQPETCPVHRFLMLAPANFGSPLAHRGRAWAGRLVKGYRSGFETGYHLLKGLELASPYVCGLAERDLLGRGAGRWYGKGRILATCLVGNSPYDGVAGAVSEDGSDGTVRIAGANPNVSTLSIEYGEDENHNPTEPTLKLLDPPSRFIAFTPVPMETHSSITFRGKGSPRNDGTRELVASALDQTDATWDLWCDRLGELHDYARSTPTTDTHEMRDGVYDEHYNAHQDTIVRVSDQLGQAVRDYLLEFKVDDKDRNLFARLFHRKAIKSVHVHSDDASHRSVYIDVTTLRDDLDKPGEAMSIALTASPIYYRKREKVGYRPLADKGAGKIEITWEQSRRVFKPDRTLLVNIVLHRVIDPEVFAIERYQP